MVWSNSSPKGDHKGEKKIALRRNWRPSPNEHRYRKNVCLSESAYKRNTCLSYPMLQFYVGEVNSKFTTLRLRNYLYSLAQSRNDWVNQLGVGCFSWHAGNRKCIRRTTYMASYPLYTWSVKLDRLYYYQQRYYFQTEHYRFLDASCYRGIF